MRQGMPEFISPSTAARMLDFKSRSTIHNLIAKKEFPVIKIGRTVRIEAKPFMDWIKSRRQA